MEGNRKSLVAAASAFAVGVLALGVAVAALVSVPVTAPEGDDLGAELEAVRNEVGALRADLAETSRRLAALSAAVSAAVSEETPAGGDPADPDALHRLVADELGRQFSRMEGTFRLPPTALPRPVMNAAAKTVPGIEVFRAEQRSKKGRTYYKLKGRLGGEEYDLRIGAGGEVIEAEMPVENLPQPVRDAAAKLIPGAELRKAERVTDDGRAVYRVEGRLDGRDYDLTIGAGGEVIEAEMPPESLPQPVRDAAAKVIPGAQLRKAERVTDDGRAVYRVEGRLDGRYYDLGISPEGTVIEAELPPGMAPEAVRAAALRAVAGLEIGDVRRGTDEGRVVFELDGQVAGRDCELRLSAGGRLLEATLPPEGAPEAVRAAASRAVDGIRVRRFELWTDDGETVYEAAGRVGGDRYAVRLTPAGEVIEVDVPWARLPRAVKEAAAKAVEGIELDDEAERKTRDGAVVYDIAGEAGGEEYRLRISAQGRVIEIERQGDQGQEGDEGDEGDGGDGDGAGDPAEAPPGVDNEAAF